MADTSQDSLARAPLAAVPATHQDVVPSPFRCTCFGQGVEAAWVKAFGDLDLAGVPELDVALGDALASAQLIVLDLSEVSFIDLAGVRAIVDASIQAVFHGQRLLVAFASPHVERTFRLTGTAETIEMLDLDTNDASAGPHLRLVVSDSGA